MISGMIALWSGAIVDIPTGYALCDGNNGTPDLRNRFIVASGDTYAPDDNVAAPVHTHDFTGDGHAHDMPVGVAIEDVTSLGDFDHDTSTSPAHGTTDSQGVLPPYYSLAYIMKL